MTTSCRDNAQRFLRSRFSGADGILALWEHFVAQCPDMTLVADALDHLAGFHDYYRQPRQATKYRAEAAALRKSMAKVTA
jgi:hypothetical protein